MRNTQMSNTPICTARRRGSVGPRTGRESERVYAKFTEAVWFGRGFTGNRAESKLKRLVEHFGAGR